MQKKPADAHWPPDGVRDVRNKKDVTPSTPSKFPSLADALREALEKPKDVW